MIEAGKRGWLSGGFPNIEDDDVMGLLVEPGDIIISEDKDLLTIPGTHFRKNELVEVSKEEADRHFYKQVLVGDTVDNYPGCPGVGAGNQLFRDFNWLSCRSESDLWGCVRGQFLKAKKTEEDAVVQARCARILRRGEFDLETGTPHLWKPPVT